MKAYGSGCIDPHFLDLGTSWRRVANFTPRPLYPRGKSPQYPSDRRLGGPQSRSGQFGENSWPYRDSNSHPSVVQPIASRYTDYDIPTPWQPHTLQQCARVSKFLVIPFTKSCWLQQLRFSPLAYRDLLKLNVSALKTFPSTTTFNKYLCFLTSALSPDSN
jgi:hypothetical protein